MGNQTGLINAYDPGLGRSVEVICGDLFAEAIDVDLLVISAWENYYEPDPGSMVAVLLKHCGLEVGKLPRALDLTDTPTIRGWVTPPLAKVKPACQWPDGSRTRFRRLAVVESPRDAKETRVFQQLFCLLALLPVHGIDCSSVATPLLNTGRQKAKAEDLYPAMIKAIGNGFRHVPDMRRLVIFDLKREPLDLLCEQIDEKLGRSQFQRERIDLAKRYPQQVRQFFRVTEEFQIQHPDVISHSSIQSDFALVQQQLSGQEVTLVTLAISARKLLEALVAKRLHQRGKGLKGLSLYQMIKMLSPDMSAWSASAMHTVRTFGNWMGHASPEVESDSIPLRAVEESDMLLMLYALQRVLSDYPWSIPSSRRYSQRAPLKRTSAKRPQRLS